MIRKKLLSTLIILSLSSGALQANPFDELSSLLTGYERFRADFEQIVVAENGQESEPTSGFFAVSRPEHYYWKTQFPYEQEIIADSEYIWIYDPDLEQATRKLAEESQATALELILNGQIHQLQNDYSIIMSSGSDLSMLFELKPKNTQQAMFEQVQLVFKDAVLTELLLDDSLGQRSLLRLSNQELDPDLAEDLFIFEPPEGTDIIMEAGF